MDLYCNENIKKLWRYDRVGVIFTTLKIVMSMLNMLDSIGFWDKPCTLEDYSKTHRILDINCKSGRFLQYAYVKFSLALGQILPDKDERDKYILDNLLYGFCKNELVCYALREKIGTGVDSRMYLGIILEGALKAHDNPDCAVVVHIDEITRMDFLSTVSCIFKFLGTKGESKEILCDFDEPIKYEKNLYIVCTSNVGKGYKTANESEKALDQRFRRHIVKGILENEDTMMTFMNIYGKSKIFKYLSDLYDKLESSSKNIDRSISTRLVLNNLDNDNVTAEDLDLSEDMVKLMKGDTDDY